jgi:hypothetical protein
VPFGDFGSTIGNDAGMNLFHEFGPGIRQMVIGHAPKFVFRIGERATPDQHPMHPRSKQTSSRSALENSSGI